MTLRFRQNPTDTCLLEYSINNGVSWLAMFDYGLCQPAPILNIVDLSEMERLLRELLEQYDGTPESIAPNLTGDPDLRDIAICYALRVLVNATMEGTATSRESNNQANALALIQVVAVIAGAFGTVFLGPIAGAAIGGVIYYLATTNVDLINALSADEWRDQNAQAAVICCAYNAMAGQMPSEALFANAWDACGFEPDSIEEKMAELMQEVAQELRVYVAFLTAANEGYDLAERGLIANECLICDCTSASAFSLDWSAIGATPSGWVSTNEPAIYHPEVTHVVATRSANQYWATVTNDFRVFSVEYELPVAGNVSKLGLVGHWASGNTHGLQAACFDGVSWTVVGTVEDATPAPQDETHTFSFDTLYCVERVRFTIYGFGPQLRVTSLNQDA